jgi:hypothetical protein
MAQAPNYFYNSPWIADVGRNLASALRPPDPQELLARRQAQWQFDRAQQLAANQDADRAADLAADEALVKLAQFEQVVNPLTGQVDENETARQMRDLASAAYAGGREYINPAEELLGPYSPQFETKQILAAVKAAATEAAIAQRGGIQMDLAQYNQGQQNNRQDKLFGQQFSMEAFRQSGRFQLLNARAQQRLGEIQERARVSGGNPMKITGKTLEDLLTFMQMKIGDTGANMPQGYQDELLARMAIAASRSGNIPLAVEQVWEESGLPQGATEPAQPGMFGSLFRKLGMNPAPQVLTPNFAQPRPAAPPLGGGSASMSTTTNLGRVVTPSPDLAPPGVSQAAYDIALNETMRTGRPPDLSSALAQPPPVATPPQDVGPPAPAQQPAPTPAPNKAKPPAASAGKTPPAKALKEGINTTFKNGQTWTLKNGVPTRVK